MKWTKEPPTEPGWYWCKDALDTEIVNIDYFQSTGLCVFIKRDYEAYALPRDAEWAGPIPMPEDES